MHRFLWICLLLLGGQHPLIASVMDHPASLSGRVLDAETRQALPGAILRLLDTDLGSITDAQGNFQFPDLEPGNYRLSVRFMGYRTDTLDVRVNGGTPTRLTIQMKSAPMELAAVDILSSQDRPLELIQAVDLRLRPVHSGQDLLRNVPGLLIAQHAGGGKAEQIFMRGFDLDHGTDIQITVDGMPVNMVSHAHGQGYADLHFLMPETVERLEVNKGPYATQDGNLATAGSVHFSTKDRLKDNLVKLEAGRFGTLRGLAMVKLPENENRGGYIAGEYLRTDGFFESPQDFKRLNLLGKYQWQLNPKHQLSLLSSAFQSSWLASGQIPQRAIDQGLITRFGAIDSTEGGETSRYNAQVKLVSQLPDGSLLSQRAYASRYLFDLYSNFTFFLEDSLNGDQIWQNENRWISGYQADWTKVGFINHRPTTSRMGAGFRHDAVGDVGLYRTRRQEEFLGTIEDGAVQETNAFAYLEQKVEVSDRLDIRAGLRYDYIRFRYQREGEAQLAKSKGQASPKLQLNYQLGNRWQAYAQVGSGFHSNDSRVVTRNSDLGLLPRAYGGEVGVLIKPTPRLLLQSAVWALDLDQEFVYVGDAGVVEPGGKTRRIGADLSVRYQATDWLFADLDLNVSRPRSREVDPEEAFIPLAPTFTSIGGLGVQLPCGLTASLRYRHLSPRPANEDWTLTAEGYTLVDATVSYRFLQRFELGLGIENLLNQQWNEAQFETTSRLAGESEGVTEVHFTPGSPRYLRTWLSVRF